MTKGDINQFHSCDYPLEWHGCYTGDAEYNKYVTPSSFQHPAKMSWNLLKRIFKHLQEMQLVEDNTTIVDFMSGSGRTLTMAELFGYRSIGIELEPHFIKMIEGNRAQIEKLTGRKARMEVIQGDARSLSTMLKEKGCVGVVSPPYIERHSYADNEREVACVEKLKCRPDCQIGGSRIHTHYSDNPDNIGNLRDAPLVGITSPPYCESIKGGKSGIEWQEDWGKPSESRQPSQNIEYSQDKENIGNLPDRQLVGITSPPYESSLQSKDKEFIIECNVNRGRKQEHVANWSKQDEYSQDKENIGNQNGQTYLSEMLKVYSEAFRSGISPLVLVTKNPTRNGKLRRLDLDTVRILQLSGYEVFDYHRAILFEEITQSTLDGSAITKPKGRLSFFKRLSYEKGNVVARFEDIIFARIR